MSSDALDSPRSVYVAGRADADRPFAVCLGDPDRVAAISREQAWTLWFDLQAALVRTLPYPPTSPGPCR
jgi:hypothetical protein